MKRALALAVSFVMTAEMLFAGGTVWAAGKPADDKEATKKLISEYRNWKKDAFRYRTKYEEGMKLEIKKAKLGKYVKVKRTKVITVKNQKGKLTFTKKKGSKDIKISKKTGLVTVKKGLRRGTYKVKVSVKAAGNKLYKAQSKTVTFRIKVK